jgi:predicted phosphate transport protein (TIGR00153 family)
LATRKLLLWFEKRKKSKTLNLAQEQITLSMSTIGDFEAALKAFTEGNNSEMESAIQSLFAREDEIDNLRRATLEELSSSGLPTIYREDLKRLVNLLDEFADQVKDSARSLKVLTEAQEIPREIMGHYLTMSQALVNCVGALGDCIETLGIMPSDVKAKAERVDQYENDIDKEYLNTKMLFIRYGRELEPVTLIILRDLLDYMERASDTCARTADYLRILATSEVP